MTPDTPRESDGSRPKSLSPRSLTISLLGHVNHGKTTLVRALTGTDTDRLAEEKARGISIALGFAELPTTSGSVSLVDVPGHEKFLKTMITGVTCSSAFLLVVSALEGIMPQTIEHLDIATLCGLRNGVACITKTDAVGVDVAEQRQNEVSDFLKDRGLGHTPVIVASAADGSGLPALCSEIDRLFRSAPPSLSAEHFSMAVDRAFSVPGFGTVVTGTVRGAPIAVNDSVSIRGDGRPVQVKGVQVHGRSYDAASVGSRAALNLRNIDLTEIGPGDILAAPGTLHAANRFAASVQLLEAAPVTIRHNSEVKLHYGTSEVPARVVMPHMDVHTDRPEFLSFALREDIPLRFRQRFVIRAGSPPSVIGGGMVLRTSKKGVRSSAVDSDPAFLRCLRDDDHVSIMRRIVESSSSPVDLRSSANSLNCSVKLVTDAIAASNAVLLPPHFVTSKTLYEQAGRRIVDFVELHAQTSDGYKGATAGDIFTAVIGGWSADASDALLSRLIDDGIIQRIAGRIHGQGNGELPSNDLERRIEASYRDALFEAPDPLEIAGADRDALRAFNKLLRSGVLVELRERVKERNVVLHRDALTEAHDMLHRRFGVAAFSASQARIELSCTRRVVIPLLEHFDRVGITRRVGDLRALSAPSQRHHSFPQGIFRT